MTRRSRTMSASACTSMNRRPIHRHPRAHDRLRRDAVRACLALHRVRRPRGQEALRGRAHLGGQVPNATRTSSRHPTDFAEYRNRIGGLLLLPKSFNASYGALPYDEKLPHYHGQNLLAKSLDPRAYEHNPGFLGFVDRSGLPFEPYPEFRKAELDKRQELYRRLAEAIWSPARLEREADSVEESSRHSSSVRKNSGASRSPSSMSRSVT